MPYTSEQLNRIYDRTDGRCHLCRKRLAFKNYGQFGSRGAWEVEHSNAQAKGGSGRLNNLYPACISCNRSKGVFTSRTARGWNGYSRAPLSASKKQALRESNGMTGAAIGAALGAAAGPPGALIGGLIGALLGHDADPEA